MVETAAVAAFAHQRHTIKSVPYIISYHKNGNKNEKQETVRENKANEPAAATTTSRETKLIQK